VTFSTLFSRHLIRFNEILIRNYELFLRFYEIIIRFLRNLISGHCEFGKKPTNPTTLSFTSLDRPYNPHNPSSVTELINKLKWHSLQQRRVWADVTLMYKVV
jgi:hypothetical protein